MLFSSLLLSVSFTVHTKFTIIPYIVCVQGLGDSWGAQLDFVSSDIQY